MLDQMSELANWTVPPRHIHFLGNMWFMTNLEHIALCGDALIVCAASTCLP